MGGESNFTDRVEQVFSQQRQKAGSGKMVKRAGSTSSQKNIRSTIPVDDSDEDNKSLGHRSLRENSLTANKKLKCPGLS